MIGVAVRQKDRVDARGINAARYISPNTEDQRPPEQHVFSAHGESRIARSRGGMAEPVPKKVTSITRVPSEIEIAIHKRGASLIRVHAIIQVAEDVAFVGVDVHLDGPPQLDQLVAHLFGLGLGQRTSWPRRSTEWAP